MKIGIYVPIDDLGELMTALEARLTQVAAYERDCRQGVDHGEHVWREKREALERIITSARDVMP